MEIAHEITLGQIFALFFLVLGPMRLIQIFVTHTDDLTESKIQMLSMQAIASAAVVLTICGFVGKALLDLWVLPLPVLMITAGFVFSLSAFAIILGTREHMVQRSITPLTGSLVATTMIITPFGIATLVILLAMSEDLNRVGVVFTALYAVLVIDFLAMYFIRKIANKAVAKALQIPSVVLGVMLAALAFNIIYVGFESLSIPVIQ